MRESTGGVKKYPWRDTPQTTMSTGRKKDESTQVITRTRAKQETKRPPLYKVLFHNDDFTPMEFVVMLLIHVFHHSDSEATRIMLHVHHRGVGVAGVFPYSVAETKVAEVMAAAEKSEYPLLCTIEPAGDDGGSDEPET